MTMGLFLIVFVISSSCTCFVSKGNFVHFNTTVAADGTGNFVKIADAIASAPTFSKTRFNIHVKPGIYKERIVVPSNKTFIALIGDNAAKTIIVCNRSNKTGFSTPDSATLTVNGENFMAKFLTFQNSAGPKNGQAVAVLDDAKHTAYYKCVFLGYQDTLWSEESFQFFKECDIYGTVDFIFGAGLTVFQDCRIFARLPDTTIAVTAQSKTREKDDSGYVFQNCNVTVSPDIVSSKDKVKVFLGRPWRNYSTVIFMESFLDNVVQPNGWLGWPPAPTNLLYYAEYNNNGPRANTSKRVNWPGFHVLHNQQEVQNFTVQHFINGTAWLPETGIPFRTGL